MATTFYAGSSFYGGGLDGDIHVNANPFTLVDPFDGTKNLITANVLQRDMNPSSLTIDNGCALTLGTAGSNVTVWVIICAGTFTNSGTIATPTGFGNAQAVWTNFGGGATGLAGGTGAGAAGANGRLGGAAGNGGSSGATAGGTGGSVFLSTGTSSQAMTSLMYFSTFSTGGNTGGASGGAGAGDGANNGGASGAGGSICFIAAKSFDNTNGTITVAGGNGRAGAGGNAGGGGGGGGGLGFFCWAHNPNALNVDTLSAANAATVIGGTVTCPAGSGGAGSGTGAAGTAGSDGTVIGLIVLE